LPGAATGRTLGLMTRCEVCGNDYSMPIHVEAQGVRHTFDSFDCAIHRMAPVCEHCRVRITGKGVEADGRFFCGAHCAKAEGVHGIIDRIGSVPAT
jgi:hypothetical protein